MLKYQHFKESNPAKVILGMKKQLLNLSVGYAFSTLMAHHNIVKACAVVNPNI